MEVDEVKRKKAELEDFILSKIREFNEETGAVLESINLTYLYRDIYESHKYLAFVETEVKL